MSERIETTWATEASQEFVYEKPLDTPPKGLDLPASPREPVSLAGPPGYYSRMPLPPEEKP
jgi:hypothetical protein